jgi:enamine deaminase RidA (YjgF/YER057c/UK114 family)
MREALGDVRPANTLIRAGLLTPEMKIEIEATAFRG